MTATTLSRRATVTGRLPAERPAWPGPKIFPVTIACLALLLGACGKQRSVAAYCQVFYGQGSQLRQQWSGNNQSGDLVGELGTLFGAPQQLANFFGRLDAVAPDDIEPDVHQLQQAAQQAADNLKSGNVIQSLLGGLTSGLGSQGAETRVNQWTLSNCGSPPS